MIYVLIYSSILKIEFTNVLHNALFKANNIKVYQLFVCKVNLDVKFLSNNLVRNAKNIMNKLLLIK